MVRFTQDKVYYHSFISFSSSNSLFVRSWSFLETQEETFIATHSHWAKADNMVCGFTPFEYMSFYCFWNPKVASVLLSLLLNVHSSFLVWRKIQRYLAYINCFNRSCVLNEYTPFELFTNIQLWHICYLCVANMYMTQVNKINTNLDLYI